MTLGIYRVKKLLKFDINFLRKEFQTITKKECTDRYFITTPIFYVNADPHIGHLYTVVIADAAKRFKKLKKPNTRFNFMVGTDEHGLKVSKSAKDMGLEVKDFCDKVSQKYKALFDLFNIESDDFVRTTEMRHVSAATTLWNEISTSNFIYKDTYEGWYCLQDEVFVSQQYLEPESTNGSSTRYTIEGRKPVQYVSEINYKFCLSKFQNDLLHWLKHGNIVKPHVFHQILHKWIYDGEVLNDISVSRPLERVPWGIPVPGDPMQTMYVWFDALSSYLCSSGYPSSHFKWPPDVQIIGKDILKFHGVFWPAFLMAAGLEPPKCIVCHSHWLKNNEKISKSKGNIINPFIEAKNYSSDGFRYFLLREGVPHSDGNFTSEKVSAILNAELANTLGNLLNRCTGAIVNPEQKFPALVEDDYKKYYSDHSNHLTDSLEDLPDKVKSHFDEFNFDKGIDAIVSTLHLTNKFFDHEEPWKIRKDLRNKAHLNFVLHLTMESLRVCGILLQPIIPNIAGNLLNKLSIPKNRRSLQDIQSFSWNFNSDTSDLNLSDEKVLLFHKLKTVG